MYDKLQEKYKNVRFKNMLNKDTRAFSKFDFNSTIRKKTLGCAIV